MGAFSGNIGSSPIGNQLSAFDVLSASVPEPGSQILFETVLIGLLGVAMRREPYRA